MDKKAVVYIHTMEYYSAIKKNTFESVLMRCMKLEPIIQSEVSKKEKHQYSIQMHIYMEVRKMVTIILCLKSLLQHYSSKTSILLSLSFLYSPTLTSIHDYWKNHSLE